MNNDKLTTIDDEILDNVSGGASDTIGGAVGEMIDAGIGFVETIVQQRAKRLEKFWGAVAGGGGAAGIRRNAV